MLLSEQRRVAGFRIGSRLGPGERLREGSQYRRVYDNGCAFHGRAIVVFVLKGEGIDRLAGFVAGRKVGGAVQRNRARRLMREAYRKLKTDLPAHGYQFVFVAKAPCPETRVVDLGQEMLTLLGRSGALRQ